MSMPFHDFTPDAAGQAAITPEYQVAEMLTHHDLEMLKCRTGLTKV